MAIDVNKPSSSNYPTKLTPPVSLPPCRDYQRNKNQPIPTTTTKDPDFESVFPDTSDYNDDHKITLEHIFPDTDDDDDKFTPSISNSFPAIETTTAMTSDTATTVVMTLEEFQQWGEEHYAAEDRAEQADWPTSK